MNINPKLPISMDMSINSITTAVEFWLVNAVFKDAISIEKVTFDTHDNVFHIVIDRKEQVS